MTTVWFIRHAQSTYNELGKMAGLHDPALSLKGKKDATLTAHHIALINFAAIYSSPLRRAQETAQIVLGTRTLQINSTTDIQELDMGEFSGRTWNNTIKSFPQIFKNESISFWQLFSRDQIPNQEPYKVAVRRIMRFFQEIARKHHNQSILVVSHKGVLEIFLSETIGFDPSIDLFEIGSASITKFQIETGKITKFLFINNQPGIWAI